MQRKFRFNYSLVTALLLVGCANLFAVSGKSLQVLGEQFESVSAQVTSGCKAQVIAVDTCTKYREFGERFKQTYPITVGLWDAARKAGDKTSQRKAEEVISELTRDLSRLATEALGAFTPREEK